MARPIKLAILQSTPTDPSQAGPDNRLCGKCGGWDSTSPKVNVDGDKPDVLFIGDLHGKDKEFMEKLAVKNTLSYAFLQPTLCAISKPDPTQIRCCRAFILGSIAALKPRFVMAIGQLGLASLTGNCAKTIPPHLGRLIDIPELPEVLAYATFHPAEQREMKYPFIEPIQKGLRLKADIRKLNEPELQKPKEGDYGEIIDGPPVVGLDTEFDDEKVWSVGVADSTQYHVSDLEDGSLLDRDLPQLVAAHYMQAEIDTFVRLGNCPETWLQGKDIYDTFILAKIQNENLQRQYYFGVEDVLTRLFRSPGWKHETEVDDPAKPSSWGLEKRKKRCGYDAWATYRIFKHPAIQAIIEKAPFVVEWTHRMLPTYHRMKYVGLTVDRMMFDWMHDETQAIELEHGAKLNQYVQENWDWPEFELTNNNHLSELLYKRMGLPVLKKTKSGAPSTDSEALDNLEGVDFVQQLIPWRKANKLMTTWYGKEAKGNSIPLYERIQWQDDGTGFLPVNIGVGQTSTLRRQSEAPNMQNWGKPTRRIITTRFRDGGSLVWADYSKLEIFVLADEVGSSKLLDYFVNRGGYIGLAEDLMGSKIDSKHPNYRATKSVVLGANYNSSAFVIANTLYYKAGVRFSDDFPKERFKSEHYNRAKHLQYEYFNMFPEIPAFFERTKKELLQYQGVFNRFGQFRHLPCPYGEDTPGFKHSWNTAINFKIQSVAGFVTGISAVLLEEQFINNAEYSYLHYHEYLMKHWDCNRKPYWDEIPYVCNEVHDELLVDTPTLHLDETRDIMRQVMTKDVLTILKKGDPTFNVHLDIEMEHGRYWHVGEEDK